MKNIFVGIVAPGSMQPERALELAKEALQEAGFGVTRAEILDWEQDGSVRMTASMGITGWVFNGRRSFSYEKSGVTVEAELP